MERKSLKIKFTLIPRKRINLGSKKPKPTANTQLPYIRPKPRAVLRHHEKWFKGEVKLETLQKISGDIRKLEIRENFNNVVVRVWLRDGSFIRL